MDDARLKEFEQLYSDLNAARAAFFAPTDGNIEDEICERYFRVERPFMATPAPRQNLVWLKWEVLEIAVTREITDGRHTDLRLITMLASIKADICGSSAR